MGAIYWVYKSDIAMNRIIFTTILLLLAARQWFFFSDPGSFSREELQAISSYTGLEDIAFRPDVYESPQLVHCTVAHAGAIRNAGYCVLQQGSVRILVLTRGFPPPQDEEVDCILIPRRFAQVGSRYLVIAAMVAYQPARRFEEREAEATEPHYSS